MECPKCGTYNPDDRMTCWRCEAELPKPKQEKRRDGRKSSQTWLYVAIAVFAIITILQMCGIQTPLTPSAPDAGSALPSRPAIVYQMDAGWYA